MAKGMGTRMFIVSMKTTRSHIMGAVVVSALLLTTVVSLCWKPGTGTMAQPQPVSASQEDGRRAYLQELGYEPDAAEPQVREILIPAEFDEAFSAYNALQQACGMDLTDYRGKRVKCWTYKVTNYPGEDTVVANLYVYKDKVVGGDISSTAQDGFSHGLKAMTPAAG